MDEKLPPPSPAEQEQRLTQERVSRRTLMMNIGIALNAAVALAIATPVVAYLLGPVTRRKEYRHWIDVGGTSDFQPGETRLITYRNPFTDSWDGETANIPAYVRCVSSGEFVVFAINCAHLGCPVRWFSESQLFMCPCHGGVYYADGSRASGPPERGLFTYDVKTESGRLMIDAGQMPTLSNRASASPCPQPGAAPNAQLVTRIKPCPGTNEPTIG
jgi:menaquinol-cytochrome c reductase iron-sulfur subunit